MGLAKVTASGKGETPTLAGTAQYGPVRRVVWDPWLIEQPSVSHGDPIGLFLHFRILTMTGPNGGIDELGLVIKTSSSSSPT